MDKVLVEIFWRKNQLRIDNIGLGYQRMVKFIDVDFRVIFIEMLVDVIVGEVQREKGVFLN